MNASQVIKTKTDLIKTIQKYRQKNDGTRLIRKIMRQVKLHNSTYEKEWKKIILDEEGKKPKIKTKIDWEILEEKIGEITEQWQKKQTELVISQFLEEIKRGLKTGENIILRNYFSLGVMESKRRRGINPSIMRELKSPNLSPEEKTKLEAKKEVKILPQKRVRFKTSPQLKKEINQ